jgi:4-hydroxy-3-methylbut-2-enyl diphosphate reductase IspH
MALEKKAWQKLKRKSPKVPDITCPIIDDVIERLQKHQDKNKVMTSYQHDVIIRRMEKLRTDNELLREGGEYWYQLCKKWLKP